MCIAWPKLLGPMPARSVIALGVCLTAVALARLIAQDCGAPDWQQGLMLTALPLAAGVSAVVAALSRARRRTLHLAAALLVAPITWLVVVMVWGGGCST